MTEPKFIEIKNARVNNLQNISLKIPRNKFVVISGFLVQEKPLWLLILFLPKDKESTLKV